METVTEYIFFGSKLIADDDCNHEIKRSLLLGRKAMTNLDSILKSRDIILLKKVPIVKAIYIYFFSVVLKGRGSWAIKRAECQRIDVSNCGAGEDSWESFGQQGDPTGPS